MKKIYNAIFKTITLILLTTVFLLFSAFWYFSHDLPDFKKLAVYEPSVLSRVYDDNGQLIAEYAIEKRLFIPYEAIPDKVIFSFLSAEDKNFFDHPGIDARGVTRAIIRNISNVLSNKRLELDTEKLNFEGQKLQQKDEIDKERIQSQEDMADLRAEVTLAGQRGKKDATTN